ncbi:MAG: YaiI/YqxD family protein [Gorillibacterium sp.]|nr:YaiI/YqxD family protein [Gorillibacterium sp.]
MITGPTKILVDADACPVKSEIVTVALKFSVPVWMVASFDHRIEPGEGVTVFQVDRSDQSVDLYIANRIGKDDVLITQDFGLAAICMAKKAIALSNRGQIYTDRIIDFLLDHRSESAKIRRGGGRTKGPLAFTALDRKNFQQTLTKILSDKQEIFRT